MSKPNKVWQYNISLFWEIKKIDFSIYCHFEAENICLKMYRHILYTSKYRICQHRTSLHSKYWKGSSISIEIKIESIQKWMNQNIMPYIFFILLRMAWNAFKWICNSCHFFLSNKRYFSNKYIEIFQFKLKY